MRILFWFCALSGTGLLVIQILLNLIGFNHDDGSPSDAGKFIWFARLAVTGFLMMFGLIGLTCNYQFNLSMPLTLLLAISGGIIDVLILGYIYKSAKKLRSQGSVFRIDDAIGKEAIVYHRIPKAGSGKITLSLNSMTYEIDAMSSEEEISSFTPVQIIRKIDEKTVLVTPK